MLHESQSCGQTQFSVGYRKLCESKLVDCLPCVLVADENTVCMEHSFSMLESWASVHKELWTQVFTLVYVTCSPVQRLLGKEHCLRAGVK